MKDKFKDTKGLDNAYMSLAKHYEEHKENAIRQVKDGAFVDLLNQEQFELQKAYGNAMQNELCKKCRERVGEAFEQTRKEMLKDCIESNKKAEQIGYGKGSKETAEKYKGFIRELLTNGDDSIAIYYGDVKYRLIREDDLQELAREFGCEIKLENLEWCSPKENKE